MLPMTDAERRMCEVILAEVPDYLDPPTRLERLLLPARAYLCALFLVGVAWIMSDLLGGATLCSFFVAVGVTARCFGVGPGWASVILSLGALAYFLPPSNSFAIAPEYVPRFIGNVVAFATIMWMCPGSFSWIYYANSSKVPRTRASISAAALVSSSEIGFPSFSPATSTS